MATIALISCVSRKCGHRATARNMYTSKLFRWSLEYTQAVLKPDKIFVLSAEYYLWALDGDEKECYENALLGKSKQEKSAWAKIVLEQLKNECDTERDKFYILAGKNYYENLTAELKNHQIIMKGLTIGKRYQWLKERRSGN